MGGAHHSLGLAAEGSGELSFQPLRDIDAADECTWAAEWIAALIAHEGVTITPDIKEPIWSALANLASAAPGARTLTGLSQSEERRVGKECVSTGRYRWSPLPSKKT